MSAKKMEIVQSYLSLSIEQRAKTLREISWLQNDSLINQQKFYDLFPYNQFGFHPLNPSFITYLKSLDILSELPFVLCADSAHRLYLFFQNFRPSSKIPLLIINIDLAGIVPDYWKDQVCFFSVGIKKSNGPKTQYLAHGVVNYDTYSPEKIEEIRNSDFEKYFFYLSVREEEFSQTQEMLALGKKIPNIMKIESKNVSFIDRKKCFKLENMSKTVVDGIGNKFLHYSYDFFEDFLFSHGANPIKLENCEYTSSFRQEISLFHWVDLYGSRDVETGYLLSEIDDINIKANSPGAKFIGNFLKDKFNFRYFT